MRDEYNIHGLIVVRAIVDIVLDVVIIICIHVVIYVVIVVVSGASSGEGLVLDAELTVHGFDEASAQIVSYGRITELFAHLLKQAVRLLPALLAGEELNEQ